MNCRLAESFPFAGSHYEPLEKWSIELFALTWGWFVFRRFYVLRHAQVKSHRVLPVLHVNRLRHLRISIRILSLHRRRILLRLLINRLLLFLCKLFGLWSFGFLTLSCVNFFLGNLFLRRWRPVLGLGRLLNDLGIHRSLNVLFRRLTLLRDRICLTRGPLNPLSPIIELHRLSCVVIITRTLTAHFVWNVSVAIHSILLLLLLLLADIGWHAAWRHGIHAGLRRLRVIRS